MTEDPEVYYSCSDCVPSFVKAASNGVYVEATTDHARCSTGCRSKATFVCRVYPDESASTPTEDTLFKAAQWFTTSDFVWSKWGDLPSGKLSRLDVVSEVPGQVSIKIGEGEQIVSIGLTPKQTIDLKHFLEFIIGEN